MKSLPKTLGANRNKPEQRDQRIRQEMNQALQSTIEADIIADNQNINSSSRNNRQMASRSTGMTQLV